MATATPLRSFLQSVKTPGAAPDRILLVGTEGVGKSTFAASAPSPLFIAAEDGVRHLGVQTFTPGDLDQVYGLLRELRTTKHEFKTVVVDSVDWLEPIVFRHVCDRNGWADIESPGYGKGYVPAMEEWRNVLKELDAVRACGLEIILIGHAKVANFANPAGPDYSRYEVGMHKNSSALIKQWVDAILFACYEESVHLNRSAKKDGDAAVLAKGKATFTGRRIIHTERSTAWDAKNRHSLPPILPLSYEDYADARAKHEVAPIEDLAAQFDALLGEWNPDKDLRAKVLERAGDRKDAGKLARLNDWLKTKVAEKAPVQG